MTEGHQPTVRQGPREAVVVKSQLPTQTFRPKMPAFVLIVEEQRRKEQAEVSSERGDGEASGSKAVVEVETQASGGCTQQG